MHKTDIQIAHEAKMKPIQDIALSLGIGESDIEFYGKYKAKINCGDILKHERKSGKLILVTAINPTPAGEGKTTVTVGLGDALWRIGKKAVIALREPFLGPVFGVKNGAAGNDKRKRIRRYANVPLSRPYRRQLKYNTKPYAVSISRIYFSILLSIVKLFSRYSRPTVPIHFNSSASISINRRMLFLINS